MSDDEFEPSSSSSGSEADSDYAASDQENERQPRRPAAAAGPRRGAGSGARPRPAPAAAPAPKRARLSAQPKLTDILRTASKEQLVELVLELHEETEGGLEGKITRLLPPPDLTGIQASITALSKKVTKAFPHSKWGSNRDSYAYKRVGPPLRDLKAALLEHGRTFAECKRHDTLLEYALFALATVDDMPQWNEDAHNKPKQQAAKQLEGLLLKALKAGAASTAERRGRVAQQVDGMCLPLTAARAALGLPAP